MEKYFVVQAGNILKVFNFKEDAEAFKENTLNWNFNEARKELGYEEDLSENESKDAAFQAGYDYGECEIYPLDLEKYKENDSIFLGQDEFSYEDIKEKFDNAE